jgi:prepilin-type N-terminal cleavage/methylation domain-containing protein
VSITPRQYAFTMVELVCAIVLLAVLAGVIVPRILSWDARRAEEQVLAAADLLTSAGRRSAFSTQRVAVEFDAREARLSVVWRRPGDPASFDADPGTWEPDPLTPAVTLEGLRLVRAWAGQEELNPRGFRAALQDDSSAGGRVPLALMLAEERSGRRWVVRLPALSDRARVIADASEADLAAADPDVVDLDALGMREQPW